MFPLLAEMGLVFDNPKPVQVSRRIIESVASGQDIVLDFFGGSGTSAHATLELNAANGSNVRFILVQLAESISDSSLPQQTDYRTIAELCKERIRKAGAMVAGGVCHSDWKSDIGFRVLKVDSSNMKDVFYRPDELKRSDLFETVENIKEDRSSEDLLFQVLVDWGVDLMLPIRQEHVQDKAVFFVNGNSLVACFESGVTEELAKELASRKPVRVVFRDNGFITDAVKINVEQIFRQLSPASEVRSI